MGDLLSDFSIYKVTGKVLIGFIFAFFLVHIGIFFQKILDRTEPYQANAQLQNTFMGRLEKNFEREMIPTIMLITVIIISRGITLEGIIATIIFLLGYLVLLVGELLQRPDLKIIGRVGYGSATLIMAGFAVIHYNKINAVLNNAP